MQALSFAVHIPLVCFGIAFPAMVLFMEWLGMRTGDPLYRTVARRWSRIVLALFAIGVITGTILSFEMGLLWPNFTATFGSVFGLGFAIEGFSFFMEAIFVGIYAYGWDRLSPRMHFLSGLPIVLTGFTGSLTVISVNAWMNHPGGFHLVGGKVVDVDPWGALFGNSLLWSELIHMYVAGYMVTGFVMAGAYAFCRLRGRWTRYERVAMTIPLTIACLAAPVQVLDRRLDRAGDRGGAADQAGRDRGAVQDDARRQRARPRLVHQRPDQVRDRDPPPLVAAVLPQLERPRHRPGDGLGEPASADQRHPPLVPDDGRDRHAAGAARRLLSVRAHPPPATSALQVVLLGGRRCRGPPRRWR